MANLTVIELVKYALEKQGYDGLHYEDQCACECKDLAPCGEIQAHCTAGYKVSVPAGIRDLWDWYICDSKEDRPWE